MAPLTKRDKVLIEALRLEHGYGAKRIRRLFPGKNWPLSSLKYTLKKIDQRGTSERVPGSGGSNKKRTQQLGTDVQERICGQEENPGTHTSQRRIANELQISRRTVQRVIKKDLQLNVFKRVPVQELSVVVKTKRLNCCRALLNRFPDEVSVRRIWFSDEKIFTVSTPINSQNCRVYGRTPGKKKRELSLVAPGKETMVHLNTGYVKTNEAR